METADEQRDQANSELEGANEETSHLDITLSEEQQEAYELCASSPQRIFIITGKPGTGKTTLAFWILQHYLEETSGSVALCAPTGRAAKRLSEKTGYPASTIHRLLQWDPRAKKFSYDKYNKLPYKAVVCDETSMVDIFLFNHLLEALDNDCKLILSGDPYQLPPVGPGAPFRDLIACGAVPYYELSKIHRQAADNRIITASHAVLDGNFREITWDGERQDFQIIEMEDEEKIADYIEEEIMCCKQRYGVTQRDVQVLSPMKKAAVGTYALNTRFQNAFNPKSTFKQEYFSGSSTFREGDRVIQMKNNYDLGVMNGDLGIIKGVHRGKESKGRIMTIDFDDFGDVVLESSEQVNQIAHAYSLTVHKSQGSEYPLVIIPCHSTHTWMWRRPLLYTAITRAQSFCVLVGDTSVMVKAIKDNKEDERQTFLGERVVGS